MKLILLPYHFIKKTDRSDITVYVDILLSNIKLLFITQKWSNMENLMHSN